MSFFPGVTETAVNPSRPKREITFAYVLLWASLGTCFACTLGQPSWENGNPLGLTFLAIAIGLAFWALALAAKERPATAIAARIRSVPRRQVLILVGLVLAHLAVAFVVMRQVDPKQIDTYVGERDAVHTLLSKQNPYGGTQENIYSARDTARFYGPGIVMDGRVQVGFQYPPLTLPFLLPGYVLGDVRYSFVLAIAFTAVVLFLLWPSERGLILATILLANPFSFFVESRCWTEPMVLLWLALTVYASYARRWWLPIALGLFLASKQYNFLALPFTVLLLPPGQWRAWARMMMLAVVTAVVTILPFALWNWHSLIHDLVLFHLRQPFRQDALSFAVPFHGAQAIGPLLVLGVMVWVLRRTMHQPVMFAAGYGVALLVFVATSKQAFDNYYFLVSGALLLGVAAVPGSPLWGANPRNSSHS